MKSTSGTRIKEERVLLKEKEQTEASKRKYFTLKTVAKPTKGAHTMFFYVGAYKICYFKKF